MTLIEALCAELERRGLSPRIWDKHGKLRVYIAPSMGKRFEREGRAYFDYADVQDQLDAKEEVDGSISLTTGTRFHCYHPTQTVAAWAWGRLRGMVVELSRIRV